MLRKKILRNIEDEYITESELLQKLDITHEKLRNNIKNLKEAGYQIAFDDDKGYKLKKVPDILEPFEISRGLGTKYIGHSIHFYEELESTNNTAKQFVNQDAEDGTIIIAAKQTAGRTRKHEKWASPEGGIYMTMLLRPDVSLEEASKLTIVTGVAIAKTLHDEFDVNVGIKWPNDVLIGKKKICGILTEAVTDYDKVKAVLVGIGIDVNIDKKDIPDELKNKATSVKEEVKVEYRRADILRAFFKIFEELYDEFKKGNFKHIVSEWRRLSSTSGNRIKAYKDGHAIIADAVGIDNNGALIIELADGKLDKITSGEIIILDDNKDDE